MAFEASVRQLIAEGKSRTALENAKSFHKAQNTHASESLLLDAYMARIRSLSEQNMAPEAKSLIDLVRDRFPSAKQRLDGLSAASAARGSELEELLRPLNDPQLDAARRAAIEQIVQTQVANLTALAGCSALPPEHSLRRAAAALDVALTLVTSGPVTDEQIALPEVSHRSPLAPWKVLIRAIAHLYRGEPEACRESLALIKPESVPARLIPAMHAMVGVKPAGALKPAEAALVSHTTVELSGLRRALVDLDRALSEFEEEDDDESRVIKMVRAAVRECQRSAPGRLEQLKQIVYIRASLAYLDLERLTVALEGAPRQDAAFLRTYARALETSGDADDVVGACEVWEHFREAAVREGCFAANSVESATLHLHMAEILGRLPDGMLEEARRYGGPGPKQLGDDSYYLFPGKLFARACVLDPHSDAFSRWMRWAREEQSVSAAEDVARHWNKILPGDLEPLLYLMKEAENRNAFPTALSYLEKAERVDPVHSEVRAARLKLLAAAAMRHLQQKKPHLAVEKIAAMEALPESRQGDRMAFVLAMRHLASLTSPYQAPNPKTRLELENTFGGAIAAGCLLSAIASVAKRQNLIHLDRVALLSRGELASIPAAVAKVLALTKGLGIVGFSLPIEYFAAAEAQFAGVRDTLDVNQLRWLAEVGAATGRLQLAWAASGAGLKRGDEAVTGRLLLMRASAVPRSNPKRAFAIAGAAAEFGRLHHQTDVVDEALHAIRNPRNGETITLTITQAREVVRRELKSPDFPTAFKPGPDYDDLLELEYCQCPECRRQRGDTSGRSGDDYDDDYLDNDDDSLPGGFPLDEIDEVEMRRVFDKNVPPAIPPEIAQTLFEALMEAYRSGESPDRVFAKLLGANRGGQKHQGHKNKKKNKKR